MGGRGELEVDCRVDSVSFAVDGNGVGRGGRHWLSLELVVFGVDQGVISCHSLDLLVRVAGLANKILIK